MVAKEIAKKFNAQRLLMRGGTWGQQRILNILSNPTYSGSYYFNRIDAKTGRMKDKSEWVKINVPTIIDQESYDKAARLREANAPKACSPRREHPLFR